MQTTTTVIRRRRFCSFTAASIYERRAEFQARCALENLARRAARAAAARQRPQVVSA